MSGHIFQLCDACVGPTYDSKVICQLLNNLRKEEVHLCDVKLVVDNVEHAANKIVLAAFSPYFKAMFSGNFAEGSQSIITLDNIDSSSVMHAILDYAYTGKIELQETNCGVILSAANYFQSKPLVEECCRFLGTCLNVGNCLEIYSLACDIISEQLKESAIDVINQGFQQVYLTPEYDKLSPKELIQIISNPFLNVKSEDVVLDAVIKWLLFQEKERSEMFHKVLEHVRLEWVDMNYLDNCSNTVEVLITSPDCISLIEKAKKEYANSCNCKISSPITKRCRLNSLYVEAIGVVLEPDYITSMLLAENGTQYLALQRPTKQGLIRSISSNHKLLLSSMYGNMRNGHLQLLSSTLIWTYDIDTDAWVPIAPLTQPREKVGFVEVDGVLFAIGGKCYESNPNDGRVVLTAISSSVERYDRFTRSWSQVAPLLEPVCEHSVFCIDGMLYVIGGSICVSNPGQEIKFEFSTKIYKYDPNINSWACISSSVPNVAWNLGSCALNGLIFVFSEDSGKEVHAFDVATETWKLFAPLSYKYMSGPVVMNGNIFVATKRRGRYVKSKGRYLIERYSLRTNTWREFANFGFGGRNLSYIDCTYFIKKDR